MIRSCIAADLPQILKIERLCYPRPWSESQFIHEIEAPYASLLVVTLADKVAGYLCCRQVAGELHILNIATAPGMRRGGVAGRLLQYALQQATAGGAEVACLEVRCGNIAAINLYRRFGFTEDCVRPEYYTDGEAAVLMSRQLEQDDSTENPI